MFATQDQLIQVFMPLLQALHEKKVLDIAEMPHFYEDAMERRKYALGATADDLEFQRQMVQGLDLLAKVLKQAEKNQPL